MLTHSPVLRAAVQTTCIYRLIVIAMPSLEMRFVVLKEIDVFQTATELPLTESDEEIPLLFYVALFLLDLICTNLLPPAGATY